MALGARLKNIGGGSKSPQAALIASASTIVIPQDAESIEVTGTTGIATINYDMVRPGRQIWVWGRDATGPALTDTALASTAAGKLHLTAACTLANGASITFRQAPNGSWWETARGVNG